jgi:shikimate kinase
VSLWLRADLDILAMARSRRNNRPLLKTGDARTILAELIAQRYPIYAEADAVIDSGGDHPRWVTRRSRRWPLAR